MTAAASFLVDTLRRAARALDLRFGLTLWDGTEIAPVSGDSRARVVIADEGALASLLRRPNLDTLVRLHMDGRIDWRHATLFDLAELRPRAKLKTVLAAFGPANAADMQTWSGLMGLKPVFERMRPELIAFHDGSREIHDLPEAPRPDPDTPAPVRFIAEWDNLLIGHQRRSRIISDVNRKRIATPNGMVPGTILIDGFVQGTWKIEERAEDATLVITLFRTIDDADRADLEQEGKKLLAFLSSPDASRYLSVAVAP